ncbi:MAG TPA: polysaccharide deacetylase family protein [Solirubrobacterales bacterium]|nr:polysaccharide deacetylase family protein [Solirubrobacterales bacterium]
MIRGLLGAGGSAAAVLHVGPALAPIVPGLGPALGIEMRRGDDGVALTFDDGPHPQGTPAVLEVLRERGAMATFFLVGEQVERYPALVTEIVAAGHGVELHCFRHRNNLRLGPASFLEDAERARVSIEEAGGSAVTCYRPPYGIFSAATLRAVRQRGWRPVLWSRWGRDWDRGATAESIARRASAGLGPGDVVLLHDADYYSARGSWVRTAAALPLILDEIEACGLKTASLRR